MKIFVKRLLVINCGHATYMYIQTICALSYNLDLQKLWHQVQIVKIPVQVIAIIFIIHSNTMSFVHKIIYVQLIIHQGQNLITSFRQTDIQYNSKWILNLIRKCFKFELISKWNPASYFATICTLCSLCTVHVCTVLNIR